MLTDLELYDKMVGDKSWQERARDTLRRQEHEKDPGHSNYIACWMLLVCVVLVAIMAVSLVAMAVGGAILVWRQVT